MLSKLQRDTIVVAAHTDIIASDVDYWRVQGQSAVLERRHVPTLRAGGVDVFCDHIGGDSRYGYLPATHIRTTPLQRAMRNLDHAYHEAEESESIVLAGSVADIRRAKADGKIALVICLEGASPLEDEISYLRNFHRLGLRMLGLTHDRRNSVAEGVLERSGGGLTYFGVDVVQECNRLGIIVDVAHLSPRGIQDVLEVSTQPIIVSHGAANAVYESIWNLTDEQIAAVGRNGGVIGIHALNAVLGGDAPLSLDDMLNHMAHIAEIGGVDCLAIGPDLMENWQEDAFKTVTQGVPKFMSVPVRRFPFAYPSGFQSLAELDNVTNGLLRRGFSEDDVTKVLGGNCLRLFERVWSK